MVQRPPDKDDPTSEEEALEFDGTHTDQLDDTYRLRVVVASESASGAIGFDDRGQAQWKWITELGPASSDASGTFDQIKALENPALSIEDATPRAPERPGKPATIPTPPAYFPNRKSVANTFEPRYSAGSSILEYLFSIANQVRDLRERLWQSDRMPRMEVDDLRVRCRAAFAVYEAHFSTVIEQSKSGALPAPGEHHAEEAALYEFGKTRRDLLHAIAALNPYAASWNHMTDDATIKVKDLRVGDHVSYRDPENTVVQSTVQSLVRGRDARLVGFYPAKKNELGPRVAVSVDRIVKAWRPSARRPMPHLPTETTSDLLKALENAAIVMEEPAAPPPNRSLNLASTRTTGGLRNPPANVSRNSRPRVDRVKAASALILGLDKYARDT